MDAEHAQRRAALRASEARAADAAHTAARQRAEPDLAHAEARAAVLGEMPDERLARRLSTRGHEHTAPAAPGTGTRLLRPEQRMADHVVDAGLVPDEHRDLSLGKCLRGYLFGEWQGADRERRAMA